MKNIIKTGALSLIIFFLASCAGNKDKKTGDSITVKIDSNTRVSIDGTKKDTSKMDTSKKDTSKKM